MAICMTAVPSLRRALYFIALLMLTGCTANIHSLVENNTSPHKNLSSLPYHPLAYHLDLSSFAYHLYGQTLVWPFDPYFEEFANRSRSRIRFMQNVRAWAKQKGAEQVKDGAKLGGYRGPGVLGGFDDNKYHDPIVYRYDRLYPWGKSITHSGGLWTEYMTPKKITGQIRNVYMCYRKTGQPLGAVAMEHVVTGHDASGSNARDVLLAFEGGTGGKGARGQPASQSLMGFVLLRYLPGLKDYDVHIAFRGSRSGSVTRAVRKALSEDKASGNPDWITDLGYNRVEPNNSGAIITKKGSVHRGFTESMKSILPQIIHCLRKVDQIEPRNLPNHIYLTGHSLGGGLAQHFVSAVLLGDKYGPGGMGKICQSSFRTGNGDRSS